MTEPTGFTAVGMVGFTDQGTYSASATYVKNDLVHYGGSIWCCLIDDTTGITPTEGVNWRFWVENSQNGISDIVNILGAKNLLVYPYYEDSRTSNGVAYTVNNDGSITADGTASLYSAINLTSQSKKLYLPQGDYILSCDGVFNQSKQYFSIWYKANSSAAGVTLARCDITKSNEAFTITQEIADSIVNGEAYLLIRLVMEQGTTIDNTTFYPMIRPKNIEDDTWQPYTKTNKELTEEVTQNSSDIQTLANNVATNAADIQTLTNNLTSIKATGSTNNTGATILNRTYFYLNGVLVRAKTDIASGATFTLNTNYEVVTAGGLNALVQEHSHLLLDNGTIYQQGAQVIPQNGSYTIPRDGYYILTAIGDDDWGAKFYLDSARSHVLLSNSNKYGISICIPFKKDTVIYTRADHGQYSVDGAYIW